MGFKKHDWMSYQRTGDIIEITLRDSSGGKIDSFRCDNKKAFPNIARIIAGKYGWNWKPEISAEESINNVKKEAEEEKKWLDKEAGW